MNHQIACNLKVILKRIQDASLKRAESLRYFTPRLVAVSKTKPLGDIIAAYNEGQRHFGENYVQELVEKAHSAELRAQCPEIKWHFIGNFQKNKANKLLAVPGLFLVETVDSVELADVANRARSKQANSGGETTPLNIMIQVNTSGEEQKGGVSTNDVCSVYEHVTNNCKHLKIVGLMTIGSYEASVNVERNPDFEALVECRKNVCEKFNLDVKELELSMGMSHDFEQAILMGSSNIRVGSLIFGTRA